MYGNKKVNGLSSSCYDCKIPGDLLLDLFAYQMSIHSMSIYYHREQQ